MTQAAKITRARASDAAGSVANGPRPIVKWAGGKHKLVPELRARMPKAFGCYFEPFAGGLALFFDVNPDRAFLTDTNADLIELYQEVAREPEPIARYAAALARMHTQRVYFDTRERWNTERAQWAPYIRAATFLYLNRSCFNGLFRLNRRGLFNVPPGRYRSIAVPTAEQLSAAQGALQGRRIFQMDFRNALAFVNPGDFVYADPPYVPLTKSSSFTSYTSASFGAKDQAELAHKLGELVELGAMVMASNSDTDAVRALYGDRSIWTLHEVKAARSINSKGGKRGEIGELVITGGVPS